MPHANSLVLKRTLKKRGGLNIKKGLQKTGRFARRHAGKIALGTAAAGAVAMGMPYALPAMKTAAGAIAAKAGDVGVQAMKEGSDYARKKAINLSKEAVVKAGKESIKKGLDQTLQVGVGKAVDRVTPKQSNKLVTQIVRKVLGEFKQKLKANVAKNPELPKRPNPRTGVVTDAPTAFSNPTIDL